MRVKPGKELETKACDFVFHRRQTGYKSGLGEELAGDSRILAKEDLSFVSPHHSVGGPRLFNQSRSAGVGSLGVQRIQASIS